MVNVILVDDEAIVRLTLSSIIDWKGQGIEIVGTYANGKQVLTHMDRNDDVDLVITDINMPILSGLELIKELQEKYKRIEFLVISAYDDYDLVRDAFKLGITDYILKQNICEDTLTKLIKTIVKRIGKPELGDESEESEEIETLIYQTLFESDSCMEDMSKLEERLDHYLVCVINIDRYRLVANHYGADIKHAFIEPLRQTILQMTSLKYGLFLVNHNPSDYVLIVNNKKTEEEITIGIKSMLNRIITQLHTFMNIDVTIAVSPLSSNVEELRDLYEDAKNRIRYKHIFDCNTIIYPESSESIEILWKRYRTSLVQPLVQIGIKGDRQKLSLLLDRWQNLFNDEGQNLLLEDGVNICLAIICETGIYLENIQDSLTNVFGKHVNYIDRVQKFTTIAELIRFTRNWIDWLMDYMENQFIKEESNIIKKTKEYIKANYMNQDLSLRMVSDKMGFSQKHFSSLFSKEAGMTYSDFLTEVRIEKAKELMVKTNNKVYEIGIDVGYRNTEHFSRVFKKHTGFSPNEYRSLDTTGQH